MSRMKLNGCKLCNNSLTRITGLYKKYSSSPYPLHPPSTTSVTTTILPPPSLPSPPYPPPPLLPLLQIIIKNTILKFRIQPYIHDINH